MNLQEWLKLNKAILSGRPPHEVAHLALTCGFTAEEITNTISDWSLTVQARCSPAARLDFHLGREFRYIEERAGNISLREQWFKLWKKIELGQDFDE